MSDLTLLELETMNILGEIGPGIIQMVREHEILAMLEIRFDM